MRRVVPLVLLVAVFSGGCTYNYYRKFVKSVISVQDAMKIKSEIDEAANPARKHILYSELQEKMVRINKVLAKKVIPSVNIDYDFCVVVDIPFESGLVSCYIYSKDTSAIAKIVPDKTYVKILGDFSKFFSTVEGPYVNIEIVNSDISIAK